ncbi:MAG: 50S ribosomal protein L16 [Candidatus Omnitrophica bacterium]|nr:50S ribosomal protein L16 [Candidatus Omnitrophota bacterium]
MVLMPKRVKYRKYQRGRRTGIATRGATLAFGDCGLQALENDWLTNVQIEACRVTVMRSLQGAGKLWIRAFPDKSVTKKPAETRMGKGKGMPLHWVAIVKRGKIIFELGGVSEDLAKNAMRYASSKLPFRTRFVTRKTSG